MSNNVKFPDAIVFPDGTIRLITVAAKYWAYTNTTVDGRCKVSDVPDYVDFDDSIPEMMEDMDLALTWERVPVGHYRSRRRHWPKSATSGGSRVIDFLQRIPKQYREDAMCRAYGRHRQRQHRPDR